MKMKPSIFLFSMCFFLLGACDNQDSSHSSLNAGNANQTISFFVDSGDGKKAKSVRLNQDGIFLNITHWKTDDGIIKIQKSSSAWVSETGLQNLKNYTILESLWLHVFGELGTSDYIVYLPNELSLTIPATKVSKNLPLWLGIFANDDNGNKKERYYPFTQRSDVFSVEFTLLERDVKWLVFSSGDDPRKKLFKNLSTALNENSLENSKDQSSELLESSLSLSKRILRNAGLGLVPSSVQASLYLFQSEDFSWKAPMTSGQYALSGQDENYSLLLDSFSSPQDCRLIDCTGFGELPQDKQEKSLAH